jgi:hypothetical protein
LVPLLRWWLMGAWGAGSFQDDTALDWLWLNVQKPILDDIQSFLDHHDEGSGPAILAAIEVLALLCEHLPAVPPKPQEVTAWHKEYVRGWKGYIDGLEPTPDSKAAKLAAINAAFEKLLGLSRQWQDKRTGRGTAPDRPHG